MKRLALAGVAGLLAAAAPAAAQQLAPDSADVHVVRPGDTLWDLARQYLADPYRWPDIFSANRGVVADPHLIFPQERLTIPGSMAAAAAAPAATGGTPAAPRTIAAAGRTVFYSAQRQVANRGGIVRETPREEVPVVPSGRFYAAGVLAPDSVMAPVGRLVEVVSPTVVERSTPPQIQPYDRVTMIIGGEGVVPGERVHLMRRTAEVEPYGNIWLPTGSARVLEVEAGVATLEVDHFDDRVEIGDLAFTMPTFDVPAGVRPVPASGLEGELLTFVTGEPVASTEDIAFVNLGAASGVVTGDEFEAYLPATQAEWGRRPEVVVARLQVLRAGELTSAVRVVSLEQPALAAGIPIRLVARMP